MAEQNDKIQDALRNLKDAIAINDPNAIAEAQARLETLRQREDTETSDKDSARPRQDVGKVGTAEAGSAKLSKEQVLETLRKNWARYARTKGRISSIIRHGYVKIFFRTPTLCWCRFMSFGGRMESRLCMIAIF